jgi:hypothetical protein
LSRRNKAIHYSPAIIPPKDIDGLILYYDGLLIGEDVRRSLSIHWILITKHTSTILFENYIQTQIEQYLRRKETEKAKQFLRSCTLPEKTIPYGRG